MERIITRVAAPPKLPVKQRVAAYARVSSGKDAMLHSLSAQVSYYSGYIQRHAGWEYVGVYADEAKTGTKDNRENFQRMLSDCRAGKIDLVITKSISRFARNTVTLLETVRELKRLGVDVYFEEQNIHSISGDGELMLTILASYAQEESLSASENQKWRVRRNFEDGKPWNCTLLGYRNRDGKLVVIPEEAAIVKRIFSEYLAGKGIETIARELNADRVATRTGESWYKSGVMGVLRNYAYTGNLILQKTYIEDPITKRKRLNRGELPKFLASNTHEPIIPIEQYEAVQCEIASRARKYTRRFTSVNSYPFTKMLVCGKCGKSYRRKTTDTGAVWICSTYNTLGKAACASKRVPEAALEAAAAAAMGTPDFDAAEFRASVQSVVVEGNNRLTFHFKDRKPVAQTWRDRSRSESWTEEMREAAREYAKMRRRGAYGTGEAERPGHSADD